MEPSFVQLLAFGLLAAGANVLGGVVLFPSRKRIGPRRSLKYLLALGAGFMLAVTFFEIVPKTVIAWQKAHPDWTENLYPPMLLLLVGYLLTQFFEHTVAPHFHLGEEYHSDHVVSSKTAYTGLVGLLIHTFFDGVSIAAASQLDFRVGLLVVVAVILHKFPEGFTIGSMIMAAGKGRREVLIATSLLGAMTFAGIMLFYLVGNRFGISIAYALPLASGVTLYVAASDLIPEVNHHGGNRGLVSLSIFTGVAFFFLIHYTVHELISR